MGEAGKQRLDGVHGVAGSNPAVPIVVSQSPVAYLGSTGLCPSRELTAASGVTLVRLDERRAREALASLEQRARGGYVSPVLLAQVHTALGEHERALDALDAAWRVRATDLAWIAVRPVFDPLRGESRFARVLEGMGLSAVAPR